ncbi:hypothetical protein [Herbiconiux ginsengi]|uniref:Uncharacterized protein n=1 Tax=Herbiconiux ginsengi TaxID=381665 RepID=A0A1H3RJ12_9MICO|nr:hypothetical protein [Herbiconiux ginsengi]SDZ25687.1 hypothetical protein SAMN05216554_2848 [Herbiconiux ginsengi]
MHTIITPRRSALAVVLGLFLALAAVFGAVPAAQAHGGPFQLTVSPDGAGGLIVNAAYVEDGHPVSEIIDPVATAISPSGESVGPVALVSSPEGEGIWVTPEAFLPDGQWAVTVTTTTPSSASTTVDVTVAELAPPVEPGETIAPVVEEQGGASGSAAASGAASASTEAGVSPLTVGLWIGAIVVVLAVGGALIYLNRVKLFSRR